ncbi:hypothetical protein [Deinococcus yavapaiensis]|uniref:Uncharacterized protein n=1 Tax=Deinococcus yavapaiensis KR-236 TaxID=694435 RepID=A0A318S721_9DEIO|nr:hypothetical protein [Deinococcus yavapaiensis]PYE50980.1 hypothetical protein DES52_11647 [Deinococcus yavapaiensis KR-236]
MSNPPDDVRAATEHAVFAAAREHVGNAGFAQRDVLERLINAGREQILFTSSLHQVLATTLQQLHALPLMDLHHAAEPHVTTLENIVQSSWTQLETADRLRDSIQQALAEVRGTPVEEISVQVLSPLSQMVQRQAADLQALISLALDQASNVDQITTLQRISTQAHAHLQQAKQEGAERALLHLDQIGQDALNRIRALEVSGTTHAEQQEQLEHEALVAHAHLAELEERAVRDAQEVARLEAAADVLRARTTGFEAAAAKTQERIARLRAQIEQRHHREREVEQQAQSDDGAETPNV